jgi:signal transduction histidine kinase
MFKRLKYKGLHIRTKLILTYSLVALLAVLASGAVALPLLQSYQDSRTDEERQRKILEYSNQLDTVFNVLRNRQQLMNPLREYFSTNPNSNPNQRSWPEAPSIETVRQKFHDLAEAYNIRLLVLIQNSNTVKVDTGPEPNLQEQSLIDQNWTLPTPQPNTNTVRLARTDGTITLANKQQYNLILRIIPDENSAPNLFGLDNRGKPVRFVVAMIVPEVAAPQAWRELTPILGLAALVALVVSFVAGLLLARNLSRPLIRLTQATQAVGRGDYQQHVSPEGGYEMTRLAESFNHMTQAVARSQRTHRQLIANVSHELKTPLTSIQGFSQAMLDGALRRPEDFAHSARIISHETARMIRLVNGLLDLSNLESGQVALQLHELDLSKVLKRCLESFEPSAETAEITLQSDFSAPLLLQGDADRLNQVFNNLIDNALKYTPAGGTIQISARQQGSRIVATVTDSGSGIPTVDLPHIFERFYQADKSRRRDLADEGSGLGLAICKEIITAHGGSIEASSTEGKGSQFTLSLPALPTKIATSSGKPTSSPRQHPDSNLVNKK